MRRLFACLFGLSLFLAPLASSARAQSGAAAALYPPDLSAFPQVSALLDVFDNNGIFATGLKPEAITIIEDGQPKSPTEFIEEAVPTYRSYYPAAAGLSLNNYVDAKLLLQGFRYDLIVRFGHSGARVAVEQRYIT